MDQSICQEMWAQKCLKDADVTLAEEEYTDFELRLDGQSFEPLFLWHVQTPPPLIRYLDRKFKV